MKLLLLTALLFVITSLSGIAQLTALMYNCAFLSVQSDTAYLETYIAIPGKDVTYIKNEKGKLEGQLEITLLYLKDTTIVAYAKYLLSTPEMDDTTNLPMSLLDQRRISLPDGDYTVKLRVADLNNPDEHVELEQSALIFFDRSSISFSGIQLVESYSPTSEQNIFSKNGYDIRPQPWSYFSSTNDRLIFYQEIYHATNTSGADEELLFSYSILHSTHKQVVGQLSGNTKQKAADLNILLAEMDITDVPSGSYLLEIQVRNRSNELLGENVLFFQRSNRNSITEWSNISLIEVENKFVTLLPDDSMEYYVSALAPIAENYEQDFISNVVQRGDPLLMKQFLYNFWIKRDMDDPVSAFYNYMLRVHTVEKHFKTPIYYGFETDRGRVYLQYGSPDQREVSERAPGAFPYEIWHYYKLSSSQSNVRFVFYNPDLITNDYKLIHSEAIGEIYDSRWKFKIYDTFKDNSNFSDLDETEMRDSFGGQLDDDFE